MIDIGESGQANSGRVFSTRCPIILELRPRRFHPQFEMVVLQRSHVAAHGIDVPPSAKLHDVRQRSQCTWLYSRCQSPCAAAMRTRISRWHKADDGRLVV